MKFLFFIFFSLILIFVSSCNDTNLSGDLGQREVKTISVAVKGNPSSLNPFIAEEENTVEIRDMIFLSFCDWNDKWEIIPRLASISNDNLSDVYYFKNGYYFLNVDLSPEIRWSDGLYVYGGDAALACQLMAYPAVYSYANWWLGEISRLKSVEPYSFEIKTSLSDLSFIPYFKPLSFYSLGEKVFSNSKVFFKDPLKIAEFSNGPYKIDSAKVKSGKIQKVSLVYNDEFFKKTDINKIDVDYYKSFSSFKKFYSKYDFFPDINLQEAAVLEKDDRFNVFFTQGTDLYFLYFNMEGIFREKYLRDVIYRHIDRGAIAKELFGSTASFAKSYVHDRHNAFVPLFDYSYSKDEADKSLSDSLMSRDESGNILFMGVPLSINVVSDEKSRMVALKICEFLKKSGFNANLNVYPFIAFEYTKDLKRATDIYVSSMPSDVFINPAYLFSSKIAKPIGVYPEFSLSGWNNAENLDILYSFLHTADLEERRENLIEHQKLIYKEMPMIPLFFDVRICAASKKISNVLPRGFGSTMWNIDEWTLSD